MKDARTLEPKTLEATNFVESPLGHSDKIYESKALFGNLREIRITHAGSLYLLKITRQGKLILNK